MRRFAEKSAIGKRVSARFVAGPTLEDGLRASKVLNDADMTITMDNLGESVTNVDEARHNAKLYHDMIDAIVERKIDGNVSTKLTHMGFDVDSKLSTELIGELVEHATKADNFVRIDMEGSDYTQRTLDVVYDIHSRPGNTGRIGAVIQAYLHRSEKDVRDLCDAGIRIRLCKGAYKEPASVAIQSKSDVDANFLVLTKIMLKSGVFHGIATHDPDIINATVAFARAEKIDPKSFEFQMLYGIRRDLQERLVREGWGVRIYVPFGTEWYPYFMRRLAERPANVFFIAKNLFRR